jgi:UDP-glucose:(heptosyl)LPS alpha-1,3-glucosyltransferase
MLVEPWIFRRVREIVAPSKGLVTELSTEYRGTQSKIHMVHNPVDSGRMACPTGFDRECVRRQLGVGPDDLNIVFVSLGHFERKGLPQLLQALAFLDSPGLKLTVVGGRPGLVSEYRQQVIHMDLEAQVVLLGTKEDVRPYLWSADLFALPSHYEVFPLVALEAAAAGLPLLVTPLNGVEEFLVDGENGILVDATSRGLAEGIARFKALSAERRKAMGRNAKQSVQRYSVEDFVNRWREIYALADVNEH